MTILTLPQTIQKSTLAPIIKFASHVGIENPFANLSIEGLLQQHRYLPDITAILGICEDGLPILLDLTDPKPGSILVGGSNLIGVKHLFELAMISALANSTSQDVEILVVTRVPEEWKVFKSFPGQPKIDILPVYDRISGEAILRLCRILDERMTGRPSDTVQLLIVDDLNALNFVDYDVQVNFQWLAKEGPYYQVWTMAGIEAENIQTSDRFLSSFQTRILGQIDDSFQAGWLANARPPDIAAFHPTQQFTTRINHNWMNFWLPGQA